MEGLLTNLFLRNLIVYASLGCFSVIILKQANLFGTKRGTNKTRVDVRKAKTDATKRNQMLSLLQLCTEINEKKGIKTSPATLVTYQFWVDRVRLEAPYTQRQVKAEELLGLFTLIKGIVFLVCGILALLTGSRAPWVIVILVMFINVFFVFYMEMRIASEDAEIEKDFPDLFMLLYSRLLRGTSSKLAPTLDEYLKSIDAIHGPESHKAIRSFVIHLRKNIELYGDDTMALNELRKIYKSATLVNFFNVAIQSLRGVDNKDKLLGFKMELTQKNLESMTKAADVMVKKGSMVIWLVYAILGQFILLSVIAKAGGSFSAYF